MHGPVHTVVEVLQHEDDLVVAPVGDNGSHGADLGKKGVTCELFALSHSSPKPVTDGFLIKL